MTATKTTAVLGIAAALTLATAVYQSNQARADAAALVAAGKDHAALRARLAALEAKARAAEQVLADQETAAARLVVATATTPKPPAAASSAKDEAAKYQKALQQFLDNHPQMQTLKQEWLLAWWRWAQAPIFRRIGLTPEQIDQAVELDLQNNEWTKAQRRAGLPTNSTYLANFREMFGDAATDQFIEIRKVRWGPQLVLSQLSAALYYTDDPFTPQQTKQLVEILTATKISGAGFGNGFTASCDWDEVLPKIEPVLSPAQLQGLRAGVALARLDKHLAAAAKEADAVAKP